MLTITADELPRFMACNGSRKMAAAFPPSFDADTTIRDEGIAAHEMATIAFGGTTPASLVGKKARNNVTFDVEMADHVTDYLKIIRESAESCKHVAMEYDTSHGGTAWHIGGRSDFVCMQFDYALRIIDFKYGYRVVEVENNWTLISHAIGYLDRNPTCRPSHIVFEIFQPRKYSDQPLTRWVISPDDLRGLYDRLSDALCFPQDTLNTSNHCGKCHALALCPAATRAELNSVEVSTSLFSDKIDNKHLSFMLDNLERAKKMLEDRHAAFKELASHRIAEGQVVENYVNEVGLSNRRFLPGLKNETLAYLLGKDVSKPGLITPAAAERMGVDETILASVTERVPTGIKLKRIKADKAARKVFKNGTPGQP